MRAGEPRVTAGQARDVVSFGQEVGRVLSDGKVVGRAEPFAKVFPSSRAVKRAVGPTAWVILEDIALDAHLDGEGRLVASTNVRRIARNLGVSRNTVAKHLGRLREHGFVLHEEVRAGADGRFSTARYVLDPSAAVERFTHSPGADQETEAPWHGSCDTDLDACRGSRDADPWHGSCDTGQVGHRRSSSPASQSSGHGDLGHNRDSAAVGEQQQSGDAFGDVATPGDEELLARLTGLDVDRVTAQALVADHPAAQIRDALDAVAGTDARKPAGWVVAAVRNGWDVAELAAEQRKLADRRRRGEVEAAERAAADAAAVDRRTREAEWAAAAVEALDDDQLAQVVAQLTSPVPALGRRALPAVRARLAAVTAAVASSDIPLGDALAAAALERDHAPAMDQLPPPVRTSLDAELHDARLRRAVATADSTAEMAAAASTSPTTDDRHEEVAR
ncbi:helix-turn-helix domain-containing protein [Nitriliruptor alkaliphilus]|uniref:helix-turn-helix domain-containing protein n=1 Tax=Nitriliruptor alkaliphilus TaxID=427918 RepID=UPI00069891BB|nr:helix-turn-helix domain-containing protein [Nitriliruptor alkaliphilus]